MVRSVFARSVLASSALALSAAGCAGEDGDSSESLPPVQEGPVNGPLDPNDPNSGAPMPQPEGTNPRETCIEMVIPNSTAQRASLTAGLNPVEPVDFVARYTFSYVYLQESAGVLCSSASDVEACEQEAAQVRQAAFDSWDVPDHIPPFLFAQSAEGSRALWSADELREFLGSIDTMNEAALLVQFSEGWGSSCFLVAREAGGYSVTRNDYASCEGEERITVYHVGTDGSIEATGDEPPQGICVN